MFKPVTRYRPWCEFFGEAIVYRSKVIMFCKESVTLVLAPAQNHGKVWVIYAHSYAWSVRN